MSAEKSTYLDSSAVVKLAVDEPESAALRKFILHRSNLVSSALAQTEVIRALLIRGIRSMQRGHAALDRIELIRVNDRVLRAAGAMLPAQLRTLDAIHLATVQLLGAQIQTLVTYDARMNAAATQMGVRVVAPN